MFRMFGFVAATYALLIVSGCQKATAEAPKADGKVTLAAATSTDKEKAPEIGDKAPAWEKLTGVDGKEHSLSDLKKAKAVAVIFTCNTCPVAQAYEERLTKLTNDYKQKGVAVVAINVNDGDSNNLDAMKERAEKNGLTYQYLIDPSQKSGREFGATCTPHVFLLDKDRKIAYKGAIDDNMKVDAVKKHSLQDAIDAVLADKKPEVAETKQFGCGIHYE